ncbi:MAG: PQQ-dependent sugar dehydrogenase [Bacteroidales bacterium]|nr:PQQ-dependent sugar dehydrogenase [Bacteroidales bacterium]
MKSFYEKKNKLPAAEKKLLNFIPVASNVFFLFQLLLSVLVFSACHPATADNNSGNNYTKADSLAYTNYKNYCAGCHGGNLDEFIGNKWEYITESSPMADLIQNGQSDIGMPAFKKTFSREETEQLAAYIEKINMGTLKPPEPGETAGANTAKTNYFVKTVVSGLDIPWGLEFLPDGSLLIADKPGKLYRFTTDEKLVEIAGLPKIWHIGQGGLLDLKLHPRFAENGWIYIAYSYVSDTKPNTGNTAIMRAKLTADKLVNSEILYKGLPATSKAHHFGCRIEFDSQGYMYFTIGDRGEQENAQKTDNSNGKTHRLTDDGKIPPDNPFVNDKHAMSSIYSYGHRNQQGIALNPLTGELWSHEHGPRGGDEINIVEKGKNYGWPDITYGINYDGTIITNETRKPGMEQPVKYYVPSIAPSGMAFVTGNLYPGWENSLLSGSLRFNYVERCEVDNGRIVFSEKILENIGRVRTIRMSPDNYIYITVENPGRVLKVIPAPISSE